MEYESEDYINCNCCSSYSHLVIDTRTREFGNNGTDGDCPNFIEIDQNTEKSPGDLRRLAVIQNSSERPSAKTDVKNSQGIIIIIPIVIGTITKGLLKGLEDLEFGGRVETIPTSTLLRSTRILRRVLETWRDLPLLKLQWKTIS